MAPQKKTATDTQQMILFKPESHWAPPSKLPNLTSSRITQVAIDLETKDDGLRSQQGPGWAHNAGYICGVAVAWEGGATYLPVHHPETENLPEENVKGWLRELFSSRHGRFIFHNAPYDLGWLKVAWGINPPANIDDTTAAAVMIDENRFSYRLDDLCKWRDLVGKDEEGLKEAGAAFGFHGDELKNNLWRLPAEYVGPYAEADARATFSLFQNLLPDLKRDQVIDAYNIECGLIPLCLRMRERGIRIDESAAEKALAWLYAKRDDVLNELGRNLGRAVDMEQIRKVAWLEDVHDKEGIKYPRTPKTNRGSFQAGKTGWMRSSTHWLPSGIAKAERYDEAANKFIKGFIHKYLHRGRLHATINQFRGEEGGTRSHRFSYSDPPLQQMPERDDEIAPLIRGLFLPEEGTVWGAHDYSQQEYRIIVHAGAILKCARADEAVRLYHDKPDTDFHGLVVEWTGLERRSAKDTNFAKAFGAGKRKFAQMIGRSEEEAQEIYEKYDEELPFVSEAAKTCERMASSRGWIRLIDGARSHFDLWEPSDKSLQWDDGKYLGPRPLDLAKQQWPNTRLRRAFTHKAFNRYVQGSAARQTKAAMLECWRERLIPMLQMHDDLNFSHTDEAEGIRVGKIMREIVKLRVPMQVDSEYGLSWGDAKHPWAESGAPKKRSYKRL